ncbi:N-acetylglucosamine-6-phosphate deacetylase [Corynebacterium parakroppenstedtii]|uniref:N-acetylglucosamine-6-phosphate deacetylase n=1 Tax=Corynebacterium parakroppenstedtii TaxID=2828363 RepID=UPI0021AEAE42|nr:amidohydrolase family protein [Corynebacterium parakroppenstedtii]
MSHPDFTVEGRVIDAAGITEHARIEVTGSRISSVTPLDSGTTHASDEGLDEASGQTSASGPSAMWSASDMPTIIPGFVDLHNHGGDGGAFPTGEEESCRRAALFHRRHGTTTLLASLVSANEQEIVRQLDILKPLADEGLIAGVHLEGPFVNAHKCGAQNPDRIVPADADMFARAASRHPGLIRQITLAPESPGAEDCLEVCAREGIILSLGHTDADYDTTFEFVSKAVDRGIMATATHLFNAMPPLHHRAPGAAAAMVTAAKKFPGRVFVELIADGVHLHNGTVDMVTESLPNSAFFITDAMEAAGKADGSYVLGALAVTVADGVARLTTTDGSAGSIAGGTSTLFDQFVRAVRRGFDPVDAVRFTSATAGRVLEFGREESGGGSLDASGDASSSAAGTGAGHLVVGAPADFVVMDPNFQLREVYAAGQALHVREGETESAR